MTSRKGWRKEPARHSLAARGVRTKPYFKQGPWKSKIPTNTPHSAEILSNIPGIGGTGRVDELTKLTLEVMRKMDPGNRGWESSWVGDEDDDGDDGGDAGNIVDDIEFISDDWYAVRLPDDFYDVLNQPKEKWKDWTLDEFYLYPKKGKEMKLALDALDIMHPDEIMWDFDDGGNLALRCWWD